MFFFPNLFSSFSNTYMKSGWSPAPGRKCGVPDMHGFLTSGSPIPEWPNLCSH